MVWTKANQNFLTANEFEKGQQKLSVLLMTVKWILIKFYSGLYDDLFDFNI